MPIRECENASLIIASMFSPHINHEPSMTYNLTFPNNGSAVSSLTLEPGQALVVLGANGTGKSSLMQHFALNNMGKIRKISAHRQTWMNSDALDMTSSTKLQAEQNIRREEVQVTSRYRDNFASQRASITIYEIIDAENVRAREVTRAVDENDMDAAGKLAKKIRGLSPLSMIFFGKQISL